MSDTQSNTTLPASSEAPSVQTFAELIAAAQQLANSLALVSEHEAKELRRVVDELLSHERTSRITGTLIAAGLINRRRRRRE